MCVSCNQNIKKYLSFAFEHTTDKNCRILGVSPVQFGMQNDKHNDDFDQM